MNLRKVEKYSIGLDIGTGSVGWAVTDEKGDLCTFKGKPTWGSRIFPGAETAATARLPRGTRRRYQRRRQRLDLLQELFAEDMASVDAEFFIRLRQSHLWPEDRAENCRNYHWPLFNAEDFSEKDYYTRFPTIFHLRSWLMETDEKADLRLIYLAFHNIVKHRGNFLQQDNASLSAKNADMKESARLLYSMLEEWCDELGISGAFDNLDALVKLLEDDSLGRGGLSEALASLIVLSSDDYNTKMMIKELSRAIVGYKVDFSKIFFVDAEDTKFSLSDDEKSEAFLTVCPDNGVALFEAIQATYSSYVLTGILTEASLSLSKVSAYKQYGNDLDLLQELVRQYSPADYERFFRGVYYEGTHIYNAAKAEGYTRYNLGSSKKGSGAKSMTYEEFQGAVKKLFADTEALSDARYITMMKAFDEEKFLRRLRTSDNGRIPFQINLEEMDSIIENQARFYPFLLENQSKLDSLVTFRIPYYVGPLTTVNAAKDSSGKMRFAWSERITGKENAKIYPWNWDKVIDKQKSAQAFIERMTGMCTYLRSEPVLPKCSLLYEEYCVLSEINGAKWTQDGDKFNRFDYQDRFDMVEELFKKKRGATYKQVEEWMTQRGNSRVHVSGGQGETKFESKLSSYVFFCKDVFKVDELPEDLIPMVEQLILWSTLFEDRSILREEINRAYGEVLDESQIKAICKKRFAGWGRLSKAFLTELETDTDNGAKSILDILREGDQNNGRVGRAMVLQEILHDDDLDFEHRIAAFNESVAKESGGLRIEDLPGSPALRRSINQAARIVEEIAGIAGKQPDSIFIENTREDDLSKKGKRTTSRYNQIKQALEAFKGENKDILKQLQGRKPAELDKRLSLYFMQNGKCLYSGMPLKIEELSSYQIDHIIPQSYVKDDSFENMALVLPGENQKKADTLLIDSATRLKMKSYWSALHDAKLIGDKKYNNLMTSSITDRKIKGFIARQLVETSQIIKFVAEMLKESYPETQIHPIKASLSSQLRDECDLVKCREINDYHHAHDAYLACQIGRFIKKRHPIVYENPIGLAHTMRQFVKKQGELLRLKGRAPGSSSFIIQSFLRPGFDEATGEMFQDDWSTSTELARIRHCLDFKDCFISRMPEETSGAFWDATIYSPRETTKKLALPVKEHLPAGRYGSYSREQFAYFFVYKSYHAKKKSYAFEYEGVPIRIAAAMKLDGISLLEDYARELATRDGKEFVEITRAKIYKYQVIELDGNRLYITGGKEVRNARAVAFSQFETKLIEKMIEGSNTTCEERKIVFVGLVDRISKYAPRLARAVRLDEVFLNYPEVAEADQIAAILSLVAIAAAKVNMIDMTAVGGGKAVGCIQPTFSKELTTQETKFVFVDVSVTGMFERRQSFGL